MLYQSHVQDVANSSFFQLSHRFPSFSSRVSPYLRSLHFSSRWCFSIHRKLNNQEGTTGDLHLRKLAAAGLSHVHLLPTFDFGSVPERPEERREAELPSNLG